MKVSLYVRESSDDTSKAPPITEQIDRGKQWVTQNGHELVCTYADNGYSGGDWKRPQWNQSVSDARRHTYQLLWIWNQDRLARDTEQFLWFYRNLKQAHVRIFEDTSNEFIDMESLGGRVKHQSLAQAAEIFRLVTSDKVRKAYQRKILAGERWGRQKKSFDIAKAEGMRQAGKGWRTIAKEFGVSYQTIRRALQNSPIQ